MTPGPNGRDRLNVADNGSGVGTMDESVVSGFREIFVRSGDLETARALIGEG
jgi:hypothetical protein